MSYQPSDPKLTAKEAAIEVGLSLHAFWTAVAAGRLPAPLYPAPRAPRWPLSELNAAALATRALPTEQKQTRRLARISRVRAVSGQDTQGRS